MNANSIDKNYLSHLKNRPEFYHGFMHDDVKDAIENLEAIIDELKQIDTDATPQTIKGIMDHATNVVCEDNERIKEHFDKYLQSKCIWEVVENIVNQVEERNA